MMSSNAMEHDPVMVRAPASKSLSHRAIIAAALAGGTSRLASVLESDDIVRTMEVLRGCGVHIRREAPGMYTVTGATQGLSGGDTSSSLPCFMGESGTSCRLLTAVLATGRGVFRIYGEGRLHERPMSPLIEILAELGVSFHYDGESGFAPFVMRTHGLARGRGDMAWLPVSGAISSQFLSGLLLAAPLVSGGLGLVLSGTKIVSWPYVRLTLRIMEDFGCSFAVEVRENSGVWSTVEDWRDVTSPEPGGVRIRVTAKPYQSRSFAVEGDYSGASYLLAAGALGSRPVTVTGLSRMSLQGDAVMLDILEAMGASVVWSKEGVTVFPAPLRGITRNMGGCPDIVPTVAIVAAHATGPTVLENIVHLRAKESDRIEALVCELARAGVTARAVGDALIIEPNSKRPDGRINFSSHGDHRMAMALTLFALNGVDVRLDNTSCVSKSFPNFWKIWKHICPQTAAGLPA